MINKKKCTMLVHFRREMRVYGAHKRFLIRLDRFGNLCERHGNRLPAWATGCAYVWLAGFCITGMVLYNFMKNKR